jgi:hypothetical protein
MERRSFLKKASLATAGMITMPSILPSGRLFAATGSRKVNHVVFCLFAGGIRNYESVQQNDGNLMPSLLNGTKSISADIAGSMSALPSSVLSSPLQTQGTLFTEFRYDDGPLGHFNGHTTAITGQYTNSSLNLRERPEYPTIFELYRKHSGSSNSALNSWWVSHSNNLYPILNYSNYPGYGPLYGANQISPTNFFNANNANVLSEKSQFSSVHAEEQDQMRSFLNNNFGGGLIQNTGFENNPAEQAQLEQWIDHMVGQIKSGAHNNPWNVPGFMSNDMFNVFYAEEVLKAFEPELLVVNMFDVDICHSDFSRYCDNLRKADYAVGRLWQTIQNTPGLANDTLLIVAPEIGRNGTPNSIVDQNGRAALDHTNGDPVSKEIFCLLAGPPGVVNQNKLVSQTGGRSIDIVPTIADALGFYNDVSGLLPGQVLQDAFA